MNDKPIRPRSQIVPTYVTIGGIEGLGESIPYEGHLWLVLKWTKPNDERWMQPVRIICLAEIAHEVERNPRPLVRVTQQLPADAMPPADPLETAKLTAVIDHPKIFFEESAANSR